MAKKVKVKKTLVEQILAKAGVEHQGIQINALEGELPSDYDRKHIFKTLALFGDKTMIPQKDLEKTTGYIHGANNPVGIRQKHNFPIYIDERSLKLEKMIVSAGEVGHSIIIAPQDLADFVKANFADILEDSKS